MLALHDPSEPLMDMVDYGCLDNSTSKPKASCVGSPMVFDYSI